MMRCCFPSSHKSRKCKGEFKGPQVAKVRGGALVSVVAREWGGAFFIARILQNKISNFTRPSHASFKTQAEAQIAICTKPGTHPAHTHKNPAAKKIKITLVCSDYIFLRITMVIV